MTRRTAAEEEPRDVTAAGASAEGSMARRSRLLDRVGRSHVSPPLPRAAGAEGLPEQQPGGRAVLAAAGRPLILKGRQLLLQLRPAGRPRQHRQLRQVGPDFEGRG
jgi:hypothetical protein